MITFVCEYFSIRSISSWQNASVSERIVFWFFLILWYMGFSRCYPKILQKRILAIVEIRQRLTLIQSDGMAVVEKNALRKDAAFFVDPPYTAGGKKAGTRLYKYFELDH